MIPEEVIDEEFWGYGAPEVSEEELAELDAVAKEKEIMRTLEIPMVEVEPEEVELSGYVISTEVMCWKHRLEMGGWFEIDWLHGSFRNSMK